MAYRKWHLHHWLGAIHWKHPDCVHILLSNRYNVASPKNLFFLALVFNIYNWVLWNSKVRNRWFIYSIYGLTEVSLSPSINVNGVVENIIVVAFVNFFLFVYNGVKSLTFLEYRMGKSSIFSRPYFFETVEVELADETRNPRMTEIASKHLLLE